MLEGFSNWSPEVAGGRRRLDHEGGKPAVEAFLERANVTWLRPYLDPRGEVASRVIEDIPAPFILFGLPISYLIDRRGASPDISPARPIGPPPMARLR